MHPPHPLQSSVQRFANRLAHVPVSLLKIGQVKSREAFLEKGQNEKFWSAANDSSRNGQFLTIGKCIFEHTHYWVFFFYYGQMVSGQNIVMEEHF